MPLPTYKDIVDLLKKGATFEAQERIMELREAVLELQEENVTLKQKIRELEESLKLKGKCISMVPSIGEKRTPIVWDLSAHNVLT